MSPPSTATSADVGNVSRYFTCSTERLPSLADIKNSQIGRVAETGYYGAAVWQATRDVYAAEEASPKRPITETRTVHVPLSENIAPLAVAGGLSAVVGFIGLAASAASVAFPVMAAVGVLALLICMVWIEASPETKEETVEVGHVDPDGEQNVIVAKRELMNAYVSSPACQPAPLAPGTVKGSAQ